MKKHKNYLDEQLFFLFYMQSRNFYLLLLQVHREGKFLNSVKAITKAEEKLFLTPRCFSYAFIVLFQ